MKILVSIIIFSSLFFSCNSNQKNKTELPEQVAETPIEESSSDSDELLMSKSNELELIFTKAANTYPSDSASLARFYFKTFPAETAEKVQKQIDRIKGLLEPEIIAKYNQVNNELKPLLQEIIRTNKVTKEQAARYAYLYPIYDDLKGDALFSNILSEDENYSLVWKSMQMMANSAERDTTYISSLATLDYSISTNVELAEKAGEFVIEAIKNNPSGFLLMYSVRTEKQQEDLVQHGMMWGDPVPELVSIFEDLSLNTSDSTNKAQARELANALNTPIE